MAVDLRWQQDAACVGTTEHELFQLIERGNQAANDLLPHELWDLNRANFEHVKSVYCSTCPVRNECWEEGERTEDALWSVRGGVDPIAFESERPVEPGPMQAARARAGAWERVDGVWVCKKAGHVRSEESVWFKNSSPGVPSLSQGLCIPCRQIAQSDYKVKRAAVDSMDDH